MFQLSPDLDLTTLVDSQVWQDISGGGSGNDYPILHFMDANQTEQVTGYNI